MGKIIKTSGEVIDFFPKNKNGEFSLEELQEAVGGYIEMVRIPDVDKFMFLNEDGKILKLEMNPIATKMYMGDSLADFIVGDVVLCNAKEAGVNYVENEND